MTLAAGTRLGPYEILTPLGAGGMGEVYRAQDTRLDRSVAIKVLPPHPSDDPARRQRFEREARALSSLSHPHICTLYDIGHESGVDFLVMELLEGESLATRLEKGPLATQEVLRYGIEIADALDKAHRRGVIHRDLKPGNVVLTKLGAKLLDFGLAKASTNVVAAAVSQVTASAALSQPLTAEGTIVGTLHYMAPEQLEGKEVDARSDIFAFGAMLYEMATGRKAFDGKSQATVIAAILSFEPAPISTLQPLTPPVLDRIVKACLAKDPDARFQTAHDLKLQLQWMAEGGSQVGVPSQVSSRRKNRERLAWALVGASTIAALILAVSVIKPTPRKTEQTVRFSVHAPEQTNFGGFGGFVSLSPDGRRLAFVASVPRTAQGAGRADQLWVRALNNLSAQPLEGTEDARFPFWSPDSRFLAFFAGGKLKKIDASGGFPQTLCDAPLGLGGTWNREGVIVFTPKDASSLYRMSASGGVATQLTTLDRSRRELVHLWPHFLPDGRHFLYLAWTEQPEDRWISIGTLDSKETKHLLNVNSNAVYVEQGYLLFDRDNTLMARAFDAKNLRFTAEPIPIGEHVGTNERGGLGFFSASQRGVLAYHSETSVDVQMAWFDRDGKQQGTVGEPGDYSNPALSPDGMKVAVGLRDKKLNTRDLWLFDLRRGGASRLTGDPADDLDPTWSPDGARIVFTSDRKGHRDIYQKLANGLGAEEVLLESQGNKNVNDISPDGRYLVYDTGGAAQSATGLWVLPLFGERKPFPLLPTKFAQRSSQFSPDGRYVAYSSNESGREEVYVQTFPEARGRWQVSTAGGAAPKWRHDGKELFYLAGEKLMAVEVKTARSQLEAGIPKTLFDLNIGTTNRNSYVVTPDGQRFLAIVRVEKGTTTPITLVVNWAAELTR